MAFAGLILAGCSESPEPSPEPWDRLAFVTECQALTSTPAMRASCTSMANQIEADFGTYQTDGLQCATRSFLGFAASVAAGDVSEENTQRGIFEYDLCLLRRE